MDDLEKIKREFTDLIILDLEGKTKEEVLLNIAKFAKKEGLIEDEQILLRKFLGREKMSTTAIGNSLALPEACWIEMSRPYAFILCYTKEPVEFNSLDNKPVRIVLASLGRDKDDLSRLKPAAKLVKLLKNNEFRTNFLKVKDVDEVYLLFKNGRFVMEALELFKESLGWLKNNYNNLHFFKERDIVWEIQKYLIKLIKEKELSYKILNDYPMVRHGKFSILCDLVIMEDEKVNIAIEFKYEPNHKREDISKCKFPVVSWNSVEKDIKRVKEFIEKGKARTGYSIFIDEGGFFCKREAHPESQWEDWGKIGVLISRFG